MDAVFEPSLLCINSRDWQDEEVRDAFLGHLLENLKIIDEFDLARIKWSDEFEVVLRNPPHLPPWRQDRDFRNQWVPTIMKLLYSRLEPIDNDLLERNPCNVNPEMIHSYEKDELYLVFMRLMHYSLSSRENIYLCVGIVNQSDQPYAFSCDCHPERVVPRLINKPDDWMQYIDIANKLWPLKEEDSDKLRRGLELTAKSVFGKTCEDFRYKYSFDRKILNDLMTKNCARPEVFFNMTKRLLCIQRDAVADAGLNDEPVRGSDNLRRFRITGAHRIHYTYAQDGSIVFLNYYGDGEHDTGL